MGVSTAYCPRVKTLAPSSAAPSPHRVSDGASSGLAAPQQALLPPLPMWPQSCFNCVPAGSLPVLTCPWAPTGRLRVTGRAWGLGWEHWPKGRRLLWAGPPWGSFSFRPTGDPLATSAWRWELARRPGELVWPPNLDPGCTLQSTKVSSPLPCPASLGPAVKQHPCLMGDPYAGSLGRGLQAQCCQGSNCHPSLQAGSWGCSREGRARSTEAAEPAGGWWVGDVLRGQPPGPGAVALLHLCLACLARLGVGGHSLTTLVCPACWILAWLWPGLAPCSLFLHLPCALCTRLLPLPSESLITVQQGPGPSAAQETFQGAPPPGLSKPSRPLLRWHRASLSPTSPGTRQGSDHTVA